MRAYSLASFLFLLLLLPQLVQALRAEGAGDILVVVGGVIPQQDYPALREAGAAGIFGPGTPILKSAREVLELLNRREAVGV